MRLAVALLLVSTPAAADSITFDDAIRRALVANPDARVAAIDIERARALLAQSSAALLPQVYATGTYTRLEGDRFVNGNESAAANTLTATAGVTSAIVDPALLANRRRAADTTDATAADAASVARDVAIATARAYFSAFTAARLVEVAEHARDTARAHVDFASQRRTGGVGTELEVARAKAELATDEAQLASASTARVRAEEALGVLVGSDVSLTAASEPDLAARAPSIRADVVAQRRHLDAAHDSSALDWTAWAPSLHLTGGGFVLSPALPPLPETGYNIQLVLTVPIFDGGFRRAQHDEHLALEAEQRERTIGTERRAVSEARGAELVTANARTARDAARHAAELAAQTLDLATTGYRAGTTSQLDAIDAERTARDAATQAVIADDDAREAELEQLAATGAFP